MKKQLILLSLLALAIFSCDKEDEEPATACGVSDPIENLQWLKQMKEEAAALGESSQYSYIMQAVYEGETVFYNGFCCPHCNWILTLYDCSGNAIEKDYSISDVEKITVLWRPDNSVCEFN